MSESCDKPGCKKKATPAEGSILPEGWCRFGGGTVEANGDAGFHAAIVVNGTYCSASHLSDHLASVTEAAVAKAYGS